MDMFGTEDELVHETSRDPAQRQQGMDEETDQHDIPSEAARRGESEDVPHEGEEGQDIV